jgi:hypothetical protein
LLAIRFLIFVFTGHKQVALETIALRHHLAVFTREKRRPRLRDRDRLFWIALKKLWKDWKSALVFLQPETVKRWLNIAKRFASIPNTPRPITIWATRLAIRGRSTQRWLNIAKRSVSIPNTLKPTTILASR